jgi:SAM-dependent methyltransferase
MNTVRLPLSYQEIVDEIVRFTPIPREEAEFRVWMQALQPGWNILQDVLQFGVTPFVSNEKMDDLYEKGDGFIFDSLVYWANPERCRWIELALERLLRYADANALHRQDMSILMFGDGAGNDSLYLVHHGFRVDYFDVPGSKTYDFALKRFEHYGFLGKGIQVLTEYQDCFQKKYDTVISFEVLEHLTKPLQAVQDMSFALKDGGLAIITEDFGDTVAYLPTHLESNNRYYGRTPFLFLKYHLLLSWYSQETLFKPLVFEKKPKVTITDWLSLVKDYHIRSTYLSRYSRNAARFIEKLAYFKRRKR